MDNSVNKSLLLNRSFDENVEKICYMSKGKDYEKENIFPCSKKIKLFDELEKLFLVPIKDDDNSTSKEEKIDCTKISSVNTNNNEADQNDTKSKTIEIESPTLNSNEKDYIKEESVIEEDQYKKDENTNDEELLIDTKENSSAPKSEDNFEAEGTIENENLKEEFKPCDSITEKDIFTSRREQPNIAKEKDQEDNKRDNTKTNSGKSISATLVNHHGRRRTATRRNYIMEDEEEEEEIYECESEASDYETDLKSDSLSENESVDDNHDNEEEVDNVGKEEENTLSLAEIRKRNKLKLIGQMSNLLAEANTKMSKVIEKVEQTKLKQIFKAHPRKRRRSDSMDDSTRALIIDLTPLRRSTRQVERKYYSEGVHDPELLELLKKLENYSRLNTEFKPTHDESRYEEDFRGFKLDEAKRNMYLVRIKKRRYRRAQNRTHRAVPVPSLDVSEVTDDVLKHVVTCVSAKVYSQSGSTCHQCRQKTIDTKTFCRSGRCTGVRGQFCGVCLLNRYGEDIVKALLDEKWTCPPCRDICNCSICRNRKGLPPTGILTPLALHKGYDSVKDYLQEEEKDIDFIEYE